VTTADPTTLEGARRRQASVWRIDLGRVVRET